MPCRFDGHECTFRQRALRPAQRLEHMMRRRLWSDIGRSQLNHTGLASRRRRENGAEVQVVGEEHMFMFRAPGKDFSIGSGKRADRRPVRCFDAS